MNHISYIGLCSKTEPYHCSTLVPTPRGLLLAAYKGKECTDDQRVVVVLSVPNDPWILGEPLELPGKTGNPVLWEHEGRYWLLYSEFVDRLGRWVPENPVDRWKSCELWLQELSVDTGTIVRVGNPKKISGGLGKLGRCAPHYYQGKLLVPLYREKDPWCFVYEFVGETLVPYTDFGIVEYGDAVLKSKLGVGGAIQPTLFTSMKTGKLVAFCRNVAFRCFAAGDAPAWQATLDPKTHKWNVSAKRDLKNYSSSLHNINAFGNLFMVADGIPGRTGMKLYCANRVEIPLGSCLFGLPWKPTYSYPFMAVDISNNILYTSLTNCGAILVHMFTKDFIDMTFFKQNKENQ